MLIPLLLALPQASTSPVPAGPTGGATDDEVYVEIPVPDLVDPGWPLGRELRAPHLWPYVVLDGPGEAWFRPGPGEPGFQELPRIAGGAVIARVPAGDEVRGRLYAPAEGWEALAPHPFAADAATHAGSEGSFLRARLARFEELVARGVPGAAWFRHRADLDRRALGSPAAPAPGQAATDEAELQRTLALFLGGRAVGENLQLDRLLPIREGEEGTVELSGIEGIQVRAFDWDPLLTGGEPELDRLAAFVPADQHALLFPSFAALSAFHGELDRLEGLLEGVLPNAVAPAAVRDRYLAQLALPWNSLVRAFGERAVRSVALTGGDPYLPSGTDVALLLETDEAPGLLALLEGLRAAAAPDAAPIEGELAGVPYAGRETPGRVVSSFAADLGGVVAVTNSRASLEALARAAHGEVPRLAEAPEYRYFRRRYALRPGPPRALLVLPDEAIRRWCGPRWRIAASRRVRAQAVLLDLQATHLEAIVEKRQVRLAPDARFPLGSLQLLERSVASSEYGTLSFLTPIRELELERVGSREAELYGLWREGYARNWSRFFDPIAVELELAGDDVGVDVTVMPLIDSSQYEELRRFAGDAVLDAGDGDPHPEALFQLVCALDRDGETLREASGLVSGFLPGIGPDPLSWLGDHVSLYLDRDEAFQARVAAGERVFDKDPSAVPIALHVATSDGLRLAAFLAALRTFVESAAPGAAEWHVEEEGDLRFVRVSSSDPDDEISLYYATTPHAWILSPHRATLVRALQRAQGPAEDRPEAPWAGASAALEVDGEALELLDLLEGGSTVEAFRDRVWDALPILNAWRASFPDHDPVAFHERYWAERITVPGGGTYRWNPEIGSMESTGFGAPARPLPGTGRPLGLADVAHLSCSLLFEHDGVRARARATLEGSGK